MIEATRSCHQSSFNVKKWKRRYSGHGNASELQGAPAITETNGISHYEEATHNKDRFVCIQVLSKGKRFVSPP